MEPNSFCVFLMGLLFSMQGKTDLIPGMNMICGSVVTQRFSIFSCDILDIIQLPSTPSCGLEALSQGLARTHSFPPVLSQSPTHSHKDTGKNSRTESADMSLRFRL